MRQTGQVKLFKVHIATPAQIRPPAVFRLSFSDYHCSLPSTDGAVPFNVQVQGVGRAFSTFCTDTHPNYEKNILKIFANLLNSLWLNDAPSAYSFCNLDLHPITA